MTALAGFSVPVIVYFENCSSFHRTRPCSGKYRRFCRCRKPVNHRGHLSVGQVAVRVQLVLGLADMTHYPLIGLMAVGVTVVGDLVVGGMSAAGQQANHHHHR